jgi:hypothetical protein
MGRDRVTEREEGGREGGREGRDGVGWSVGRKRNFLIWNCSIRLGLEKFPQRHKFKSSGTKFK